MKHNKSDDHVACVLVGDFAPSMFSPHWFIENELLSEDELSEDNGGEIEILHKQVSRIKTSELEIHVDRERFQVRSYDLTGSEQVMAIVSSVAKIVGDSAVEKLGFNRMMRFNCNKEEDWHNIGAAFAPRQIWETSIDFLKDGFGEVGLKNLEYQINRGDKYVGSYKFNIFPSVPNPNYEVSFLVNDHINLLETRKEDDSFPSTSDFIREHWRDFESNTEIMILGLMKNASR